MIEVHGFDLYGMWGPVTDPGARVMTSRMAELPGINMHASPYRDYQVNEIVDAILATPADSTILLCGTSLGSNNAPVVASYLYARDPKRVVHGIWGFQASEWGARAGVVDSYPGVTKNVLFAHLAYSTNPVNAGLGSYRWKKAPGNDVTTLLDFDTFDVHPGDGNVAVQDKFLAEMARVIKAAQLPSALA